MRKGLLRSLASCLGVATVIVAADPEEEPGDALPMRDLHQGEAVVVEVEVKTV